MVRHLQILEIELKIHEGENVEKIELLTGSVIK